MTRAVEPWVADRDHREKTHRLGGLDLVRLLAVIMVLYTSLATWFRDHDRPLGASTLVDNFLVIPLRINPDLRFFGAALIFLISGFLVAKAASTQRTGEFVAKRLLRVLPPLWLAVLLVWVLIMLDRPAVSGVDDVGTGELLNGLVLGDFFSDSAQPLVGPAWALLPILGAYVLVAALLPVFRSTPWLAVAVQITVFSVLLAIMPNFDSTAGYAGGTIGAFGVAVVLGQAIWLVWSGNNPLWAAAGLGVACWVIFVWGDRLGYEPGVAYPVTLAYSVLLMIIGLQISDWVRDLAVVSYLVSRSFPILLVHQAVMSVVLSGVAGHVWSGIAVLAAAAATLLAAEVVHQAAERPVARFAASFGERDRS
jgi:exopolysaccharide production protein ExoZ